eukprot:m.61950 g.61950  ORF g.61950 m.61950 type:complete len:713 (+) comp35033_c0_seq1:67-2205(+)
MSCITKSSLRLIPLPACPSEQYRYHCHSFNIFKLTARTGKGIKGRDKPERPQSWLSRNRTAAMRRINAGSCQCHRNWPALLLLVGLLGSIERSGAQSARIQDSRTRLMQPGTVSDQVLLLGESMQQDDEEGTACLVNNSSATDKSSNGRLVCFRRCNKGCASGIAGTGNVYLSCFTTSCLKNGERIVSPIQQGDNYKMGEDQPFAANEQIHFADTVVPFEYGIRFDGPLRLRVDLAKLRSLGFQFDYFSVRVGMLSSPACAKATGRVKFRIFADESESLLEETALRNLNRSRELQVNVSGAAVLKLVALPSASLIKSNCSVGAWADAKLTKGRPLFPACLKQCIPFSKNRHARLSCFMGTCPGQGISRRLPNIMTFYKSRDRQLCLGWPCGSAPLDAIAMQYGSHLQFNLTAMRKLGYPADVFVAKVAVQVRKSCANRSFRHGWKAVFPFRVQTGAGNTAQVHTWYGITDDNDDATTEIALDVSNKETIVLRTDAKSKQDQRCAYGLWKVATLVPYEQLHFPACNAESCQKQIARGKAYLSCFLGVCSGKVATKSHAPFFEMHYATRGIGADCPGAWRGGHNSIQFRRGTPLKFGIGAAADSSITFDLNALRRHGLRFNTFIVQIGIDRKIRGECRLFTSGSKFRVAVDNRVELDGRIKHRGMVQSHAIDVSGAHRLQLSTFTLFGDRCAHAAWGEAYLATTQIIPIPVPIY